MRIVEASEWRAEERPGWQPGGGGVLQSARVAALDVFEAQETKRQQGLA